MNLTSDCGAHHSEILGPAVGCSAHLVLPHVITHELTQLWVYQFIGYHRAAGGCSKDLMDCHKAIQGQWLNLTGDDPTMTWVPASYLWWHQPMRSSWILPLDVGSPGYLVYFKPTGGGWVKATFQQPLGFIMEEKSRVSCGTISHWWKLVQPIPGKWVRCGTQSIDSNSRYLWAGAGHAQSLCLHLIYAWKYLKGGC